MVFAWSTPIVASVDEIQLDEAIGPATDADLALPIEAVQLLRSIERAFGQSFALLECSNGKVLRKALDGLQVDLYTRIPTCEQVAERGIPEILDEVSPLLMLAVPLPSASPGSMTVAVATFLTERIESESEIAAAAAAFGVAPGEAFRWAQARSVWPPKAIQEVSTAVCEKTSLQQSTATMKRQLADISSHLLMTFEEITLLHRLTEHLLISESVTDICEMSVNWLNDVIPSKSVAIWFSSFEHLQSQHAQGGDSKPVLISHGECPSNGMRSSNLLSGWARALRQSRLCSTAA